MKKYKVYKITNKTNGMIYIGATKLSLERRFDNHFRRRNDRTFLARAMKKYGKDNFTIKLLQEYISEQDMFNGEIYYIKLFDSNNNKVGYNLTKGGDRGPTLIGKNNPNFGKKNKRLSDMDKARKWKSLEEIYGIKKANKIKSKKSKITKLNWKRGKFINAIKKMSEARKKAWENGKYKNVGYKISNAKKGIPSNKVVRVKCINNGKVYHSITEAAKELGLNNGNICNVINHKYLHTKGFEFVRL
jgi:group I intron endonuclease